MYVAMQNQTECFCLKQRSVMKLLLAEKCKPYEIYRRVCDVYREAWVSQKMFPNKLNMDLPLWDWVEKTVHGVEIHWLFGKEKVLGTVISKEGHADIFLRHEKKPITIDFLEKGATVKNASCCQFIWQNSSYLLNDPQI